MYELTFKYIPILYSVFFFLSSIQALIIVLKYLSMIPKFKYKFIAPKPNLMGINTQDFLSNQIKPQLCLSTAMFSCDSQVNTFDFKIYSLSYLLLQKLEIKSHLKGS